MKDRIRRLRKSLDLTQAEFAEQLGMKQNTIATYEMGRSTPSDPAISNMVRAFKVNETWLRTGVGEMFTPVTRDEEIAQFAAEVIAGEGSFRHRFVSMLSRLSEDDWSVLEKMALSLAENAKKD